MSSAILTPKRVAGGFHVGNLAVLLAAGAFMIISGAVAGFPRMIQDRPAEAVGYAADFRLLIGMFVVAWIVQLIGVGLLCRLVMKAGQEQLAIVAFLLMLVAAGTAIFAYTFHMTVVLLVAAQIARGVTLPAIYEPLMEWTRSAFGLGYYLYLLGVIGVGWGGLRRGVLSGGMGWAAVGLGSATLLGRLVDVGAPAVPLLAPIVMGLDLVWHGETDRTMKRQTAG